MEDCLSRPRVTQGPVLRPIKAAFISFPAQSAACSDGATGVQAVRCDRLNISAGKRCRSEGAAYAQDLWDRVLAADVGGSQTRQIVEVFQVCPAGARRVKQCRRDASRIAALAQRGARRIKIDPPRLAALVKETASS